MRCNLRSTIVGCDAMLRFRAASYAKLLQNVDDALAFDHIVLQIVRHLVRDERCCEGCGEVTIGRRAHQHGMWPRACLGRAVATSVWRPHMCACHREMRSNGALSPMMGVGGGRGATGGCESRAAKEEPSVLCATIEKASPGEPS